LSTINIGQELFFSFFFTWTLDQTLSSCDICKYYFQAWPHNVPYTLCQNYSKQTSFEGNYFLLSVSSLCILNILRLFLAPCPCSVTNLWMSNLVRNFISCNAWREDRAELPLAGTNLGYAISISVNVLCFQLDENVFVFLFSIEAIGFLHMFS